MNVLLEKKITPINLYTNYRRETQFIPINMHYCLVQFDALKFFIGIRLHRGPQPNFNFFNKFFQQIFHRNRKVHLTNCLETNFHDISILV